MIVIDPTYNIGDFVYIKTDQEQFQRIVTALIVCPAKDILYELTCGTIASKHYDFELSKEKNYAVSQ
jgi:hypothetical protein